ncbi:hypothetical protein [Lentzea sp. NPDC051838]|uniref:hypothetical protein n=1 Tax=Lentzea sp. NPDC051838 TaxID=3154849 RepID=UPI00342DC244
MNDFSVAATGFGGVGFLIALTYLVATRGRREWQTILATVALVVGLQLALIGVFDLRISLGSSSSTTTTATSASSGSATTAAPVTTTAQPLSGVITKPTPNDKVDRCIKVRGSGVAPEGYTRRFGAAPVHEQDSNYYLPRDQRGDGSAWPVYVGALGDYNQDFDVVAYDVPNGVLSRYSADNVRSLPYSLAKLTEDGIKIVDKVRVSRKDAANTSNDACAKEPN